MKVYAVFKHPNYGYPNDIQNAEKAELVIDERYEVTSIDVGSWISHIYLKNIEGSFNSVQFEFKDESGNDVNIYEYQGFSHYD